jgi:hypothetical protein
MKVTNGELEKIIDNLLLKIPDMTESLKPVARVLAFELMRDYSKRTNELYRFKSEKARENYNEGSIETFK